LTLPIPAELSLGVCDSVSTDLSQTTEAHLQGLILQEVPEGQTIEYKAILPEEGGKDDRWLTYCDRIGKYARDELLEEICAFANADGGHLVLGVAETAEKPPRAAKLQPLPHVSDLAERLGKQIRDCIDPQLASCSHCARAQRERGMGRDRHPRAGVWQRTPSGEDHLSSCSAVCRPK
jgi:hypothetical protein